MDGIGFDAAYTASNSFQTVNTGIKNDDSVYTHAEAECAVYSATIETAAGPALSLDFLNYLRKLPVIWSQDHVQAYFDFLETFGTHFVKSATFGARFGEQSQITTSQWMYLDSMMDVAEAAKASVMSLANMETNVSHEEIVKFQTSTADRKMYSKGAKPSDNMTQWQQQSFANPIPIDLQVRPIHDLFSVEFYGDLLKDFLGAARFWALRSNIQKMFGTYCDALLQKNIVTNCSAPSDQPAFPVCPFYIQVTNQYSAAYQDKGTGAESNLGMYRPEAANGEDFPYYIGDACVDKHDKNPPYPSMVLKKSRTMNNTLLPPIAMVWNWDDAGTGGDHDGGFMTPRCKDGFVALGTVGEQFLHNHDINREQGPPPSLWPNLMCVAAEFAVANGNLSSIWTSHKSGGHYQGSVFMGLPFDTNTPEGTVSSPCFGTSGYPDSFKAPLLDPNIIKLCAIS